MFNKINVSIYILFAIALVITSCNKDTSSSNSTPINTNTDEYYVKYIIKSKTIYIGGKINLTITDEKNTNLLKVVDQDITSETIIGPVKKNFKATLHAEAVGNTQGQLKMYSEIHVSKNNGPFATKALNNSETPRNVVDLTYTIDF